MLSETRIRLSLIGNFFGRLVVSACSDQPAYLGLSQGIDVYGLEGSICSGETWLEVFSQAETRTVGTIRHKNTVRTVR